MQALNTQGVYSKNENISDIGQEQDTIIFIREHLCLSLCVKSQGRRAEIKAYVVTQ